MKIAYVGVKLDGETAFIDKTGITWMPGDVFEVANDVATKMLQHPDVFAKVEEKPAKSAAKADNTNSVSNVTLTPGAKVEPSAVKPEYVLYLKDGATKVLDGLEKDELQALAKELGVKVHHQAGAAKVIEALQAAFQAP